MASNEQNKHFLRLAIEKSQESVAQGGFPAGAVVVKDGRVIGTGISIGNKINDPTSHGELVAIREACQNLQSSELKEAVLYTSMQPCSMCFSASMWSGISKIFYAVSMDRVDPEYYGGSYHIHDLNKSFIRPLELNHMQEFEEEVLGIIHSWERNL